MEFQVGDEDEPIEYIITKYNSHLTGQISFISKSKGLRSCFRKINLPCLLIFEIVSTQVQALLPSRLSQ